MGGGGRGGLGPFFDRAFFQRWGFFLSGTFLKIGIFWKMGDLLLDFFSSFFFGGGGVAFLDFLIWIWVF